MSSVTVRRSHRSGPFSALLIGIGVWVAIGVWVLYGQVEGLAGSGAGWAYLATGLLMLPTVLSRTELASWIRGPATAYRLARVTERPILSFVIGWATLLGWVALSALIARAFGRYAGALLGVIAPWSETARWSTVALVFFFVIANMMGYRSNRRVQVFLLGIGVLALVVAAAAPVWPVRDGDGHIFAVTALLSVGMWSLEVTSELYTHRRQRPLRWALSATLAGPVVGLIYASLVGRLPVPANWVAEPGEVTVLALGTLVLGVVWEVVVLTGLRQIYAICDDGCLPEAFRRAHSRYGTPYRLILVQGAVALVGALFVPEWLLAQLGALALLLTSVGISVTAIILANHPRAEHRPLRLPLHPLIPSAGIAIGLLLLLALGWKALVIGLGWMLMGLLVYRYYGRERSQEAQLGITVFQEKSERETATDYTVVVPVANPQTALDLVSLGTALARQHCGHVLALQVVPIPDQLPLTTGRPLARKRLEALDRVLDAIPHYDVSIEGMTRLSRGVVTGILDTLEEEDADLLVMGWRPPDESGQSSIAEQVFRNATCDVVAVPGGWPSAPGRLLVPVAGGPNSPLAARLAQTLAQASDGQVTLLHVLPPEAGTEEHAQGSAVLDRVVKTLPSQDRVVPQITTAESPLAGILAEAKQHDMILMGASGEQDWLEQELFGHLAEQITHQATCPVLMVRRHARLPTFWARKVWDSLSGAFPSLERQEQLALYQRLRRAARPTLTYFMLIILSAVIATLGLLLNSPAVIIGAMLIAPLMMPILATAVGITFGDAQTLRVAADSLLRGALWAIFVATGLTLISPLRAITGEILARTQPTLLDLLVAFASGLAAAYAQSRREASDALPGVAIAAALMPPVCTVGVGLALGDLRIASGAFLLFVANLIAIAAAASLVFLLFGIRPPREADRRRWLRRGLVTSAISLLIISLPLGLIMFRTVHQAQIENQVYSTLQAGIGEWEDALLEDVTVEETGRTVQVTATVRTAHLVSQEEVDALDVQLEAALRRPVQVQMLVTELAGFDSTENGP